MSLACCSSWAVVCGVSNVYRGAAPLAVPSREGVFVTVSDNRIC